MSNSQGDDLCERLFQGHGGTRVWDQIGALEVKLRVGGNLLASKCVSPRTRSLTGIFATRHTYARLSPFPKPGQVGVFSGQEVHIESDGGHIVGSRRFSRGEDGSVQVRPVWDDLDLLYFLGYALWNYCVTPFVFRWPGFSFQEGPTLNPEPGVSWRTLDVSYPPHFPTHSKSQRFYVNTQGLLVRLDYTAEVFGRWVHGAHFCQEYRVFGGLAFPTHRIVYPLLKSGHCLRLLSAMEGWIEDVRILPHGSSEWEEPPGTESGASLPIDGPHS